MNANRSNDERYAVAGIGELLWDIFPNHSRIGGAPCNFAYHTHQLGAEAWPISCIGSDSLGKDARSQLSEVGVDTSYVKETDDYPTGTVDVVLQDGKPSYTIHENVAWDHIPFTPDLRELAGRLDAVCFGSLSQRSPESSDSISAFVKSMRKSALKILDVNLRDPFYSQATLSRSLGLANVLKLSDEELPVLREYFSLKGGVSDQLQQLLEQFDLHLVAYTRGSLGSLLIGMEETNDFSGCEGDIVDTVGAGDSFTAALCMGLLRGWPLRKVNQHANEVATYVCTQKGATPVMPDRFVSLGLASG
tara:strand:- start:10318 stop:11232 length:915 start_codon:yes stop_codon:yes gene_type:complete